MGVWTHGESCWHSLQHAQWEALLDPELPKQDLSPLKSPIIQLSHTHFPPLLQTNLCCAKQPKCKLLDGLLRLDPSSLNLVTSPPQKKARSLDRNATPEVVAAFTEMQTRVRVRKDPYSPNKVEEGGCKHGSPESCGDQDNEENSFVYGAPLQPTTKVVVPELPRHGGSP